MKNKIILITGGSRCGKSRHALELAMSYPKKRGFVATAQGFDREMRERIRAHQKERSAEFETIEEPLWISKALALFSDDVRVVVVDCLTVWLGNLMHHRNDAFMDAPEVKAFLHELDHPTHNLILVTNEVGMGIVPDNPMARTYRDTAGWMNQQAALRADRVIFMVSGIPMMIKGGENRNI